jgi:putative membrane protein
MVLKQLHPGAKWLFRITGFFSGIFFAFFLSLFIGGFLFSLINDGEANFAWIFAVLPVFLIILLIWAEVYARLSFRFWKYEFTEDQLRIERGIIWKRYSNIPYQRIQNVDITRGIIARLLGFSSVNIQTAGYSMPVNHRGFQSEGYIPAVSVEEAENIREFVVKKISKRKGSGL